ncbi:quinone oxidoreductase [Arthrobacter agilis]|uniref:quinone oxidoreductase family protein n=1 Tax=Arthrobacter agilis TaxID=37921 RepID=UPI000B35672D|nr:quinone oxidoreductase [Arthrobacter agilis]OUM40323.1 NADPH:quinone reductase [Arthrobacter agilis]PPB44936.1 quinone oxidoreductase [Arthrobacter agilis]TPV27641.1 quinone oxidoreductase [Arthrobacter agilis]VDR31735.1 Quinone oxidoreductase 1 [Arthrobacter agilis]
MPSAIVVRQAGGPEVLTLATTDRPEPGPGQLLVRVAAAGVNFIETYQRSGAYAVERPFTPGAEAAGTVEALGAGTQGFVVGDRVAFAEGSGTYADYALVDADRALPVPDGVDLETAAALPLQGMTAHYLMNSTFPVQQDQTVLVHAGAGGVGLLLIQLLKARGARVITTVSTPQKEDLARGAGADEVLRYDGFADAVRTLTDGSGADVVFDGVGKATFDESLRSLRVRGTLVLYGAASGPVPPLELQRLNSGGSLFVTRPTLVHYLRTPEERRWRSEELFGAVAAGQLDVRIGARYALADAARAHEDLQGRRTTGKVLLIP